jgi:hypothetical protein
MIEGFVLTLSFVFVVRKDANQTIAALKRVGYGCGQVPARGVLAEFQTQSGLH